MDGLRQSQPKATMALLLPHLAGVASVVVGSPGQQAAMRAEALEVLAQRAPPPSAGTETKCSSDCRAKAASQTTDANKQVNICLSAAAAV